MAARRPGIVTSDGYSQQMPTGDTVDPTYLPAGASAETATTMGSLVNSLTAKSTPVDADQVGLMDSTDTIWKKLSWLNIKATLKTYFDTLYTAETTTTIGSLINAAGAATPNNGDFVATAESGGLLKKISWTNVKAFLKTYFDTIYGRRVFYDVTSREPAGTTLEDLLTVTIDGDTLSANGMFLEMKFHSAVVANANRKKHEISFNGTLVASFDTTDANVSGIIFLLDIIRETGAIVRCNSAAIVTDAGSSTTHKYTRITGLTLTSGINVVYSIRNYTTATDSTLHFATGQLRP